MKMIRYQTLNKRFGHEAGTIVYQARGHDYGLARDDTHFTGIDHVSVSLKEDGDYPFFTIPVDHLVQIE
jgi:hypothetical protein